MHTRRLFQLAVSFACVFMVVPGAEAAEAKRIEDLFEPDYRNQLVLDIEAAIALAQAREGVIPKSAADEIARKASTQYTPLDEIDAEYDIVRHRMVALLNVWKRSLDEEARNYVHFGVTTVDVYDTVLVLQIKQSILMLIEDMREIEVLLMDLAREHRDTPMIGRTLGQHALPITFGKKVAVWAAMNRRNIERLKQVLARIETSGVLKGAVGTHLGLGDKGVEVENRFARVLGLQEPEPADWHGARDVIAEYALTLALTSKTYAAIGGEVFRLQMTDIGEVIEVRPETAVGSSAMPHKSNPSRSEALVHAGRTVPRLAEILLDDAENYFERSTTSPPNDVAEQISIEAAGMVRDARRLIGSLDIDTARMRANIDTTDGMVMAQRIVLALADSIGREEAEERVRLAAERAIDEGVGFSEALQADEVLAPLLSESLEALLDPTTYVGLSAVQVDRTNAAIARARKTDPVR